MLELKTKICFLNGNSLKIIAAIAMLIDHIGYLLFPQYDALRIIGRIAFPIFAFMIAEGCKYTKNKVRYFFMVFGLAAVCQTVYFVFDGSLFMSVLVSFSLAILMVYALQNFKTVLFAHGSTTVQKVLSALLFVALVFGIFFINLFVEIDYGFWGCMMPVFASFFHMPKNCENVFLKKLDCIPMSVFMMSLAMVLLAISIGWVQPYSFLALVPLLLYSGKRGKLKMKYFFYIFYPLHLVILQGISMLCAL